MNSRKLSTSTSAAIKALMLFLVAAFLFVGKGFSQAPYPPNPVTGSNLILNGPSTTAPQTLVVNHTVPVTTTNGTSGTTLSPTPLLINITDQTANSNALGSKFFEIQATPSVSYLSTYEAGHNYSVFSIKKDAVGYSTHLMNPKSNTYFGVGGGVAIKFMGNPDGSQASSSYGLSIDNAVTGVAPSGIIKNQGLGSNFNMLQLNTTAIKTGGTAVMNFINIGGVIDQPKNSIGSILAATGITRGLYIKPDITWVKDWRSIEFTNNDDPTYTNWGLYGSGTAKSFLGGNLILGRDDLGEVPNAPSAALNITSSSQGVLFPRLNKTAVVGYDALPENSTVPAGLQIFNNDINKMQYYNGDAWVSMDGSGGTVSGKITKYVMNLAELKALAPSGTVGAEEDVVEMQSYETLGDGGGGTFVWVPVAPVSTGIVFYEEGSVFVKSTTNSNGFWLRQITDGVVNVKWLGVKTGSNAASTNNDRLNHTISTAIFLQNRNNFWSYVPATPRPERAYKIYIPCASAGYFFNNTIEINDAIEIFGDAGTLSNTTIVMTTDIQNAGIFIQRKAGAILDFAVKLRNFAITYDNFVMNFHIPTTGTAHGIYAKEAISAENVTVFGFPLDGFHLEGVALSHSVDFSSLSSCNSTSNGKIGFYIGGPSYISGDEAQVCIFTHCISRLNGTWGFCDYSRLGNTYNNCSAHANSRGASNDPGATELERGGGFKIKGLGNVTRLFGCYAEDDQGENEADQACLVVGGLIANGWRDGFVPASVSNGSRKVLLSPAFEVRANDQTSATYDIIGATNGQPGGHGLGLLSRSEYGGTSYTLCETKGVGLDANIPSNSFIAFQRANGQFRTSFAIAQAATDKRHFGIITPNEGGSSLNLAGRISFPLGIFLKENDNIVNDAANTNPPYYPKIEQYRALLMSRHSPSELLTNPETAFHGRESGIGDFIINTNPANPALIGWKCTVAGQPGTWVEMWSATMSGSSQARNGLTLSGNPEFIELGGELTKETNINVGANNYSLNITNSAGSNVIGFSANAGVGGIIKLNNDNFAFRSGLQSYYIAHAGNTTSASIYNVAVGPEALSLITTGHNNTALGYSALKSNLGGSINIAIGGTALNDNTAGNENVAVGFSAMEKNVGGGQNVAIGRSALGSSTGSGNTALGRNAGTGLISGNYNLFLGSFAGPEASMASTSNKLFINTSGAGPSNTPLIGGDFSTHIVTINRDLSSMDVANSPLFYTFDVNGTGRFADAVYIGEKNPNIATETELTKVQFNSYKDITNANGGYKLLVKGKILAEELTIKNYNAWPDYVFDKDYKIMPLTDVKKFIDKNGHLPNVISAEEMKKKEGLKVGEMQTKLLEKIEELTIYAIDADKKVATESEKVKSLEERVKKLEELLQKLNK